MKNAIHVIEHSADIHQLDLQIEKQQQPQPEQDECIVEVHYAGVNPSDVAAVLGYFPLATWPRITGRDFAGVVIDGPGDLVGKAVWGTGGDLGIRRDGSHAAYIRIPLSAVSEKPIDMPLEEAAVIGVPFITAYEGLRRAGFPGKDKWVLIFGINGKVGQAAAQLATLQGAQVIGVERRGSSYAGHSTTAVHLINASEDNIEMKVKELTRGHGADVVYNTVGSPYFETAMTCMAHGAYQIFIADRLKEKVSFQIFQFYRMQYTFVGVDTQELDITQCAKILTKLKPGFENGSLKSFGITPDSIYNLENAKEAYYQTYQGAKEKIVLKIV
jgi:NADPH2:quinone reductase